VDGKDTGQMTPADLALDKGEHTLVLRKAGYSDLSSTQTLAAGQTVNFSPVLLRADRPAANSHPDIAIPEGKGMVRIHTIPEGATIQIDNRTAPRKTNVAWPADPGVYDIVLTMDGYKPVHRTVRVQKGREAFVDEILEKQRYLCLA
jgi:hypothetical protein